MARAFSRHRMFISADISNPLSTSLLERAQPVIAEAARKRVEAFNPEDVWLFGSYAWGKPSEDSDIDLMVVVEGSSLSPLERAQAAHRALSDLSLPKDILVKTRDEVDRVQALTPSLTHKIITEGRLIFRQL